MLEDCDRDGVDVASSLEPPHKLEQKKPSLDRRKLQLKELEATKLEYIDGEDARGSENDIEKGISVRGGIQWLAGWLWSSRSQKGTATGHNHVFLLLAVVFPFLSLFSTQTCVTVVVVASRVGSDSVCTFAQSFLGGFLSSSCTQSPETRKSQNENGWGERFGSRPRWALLCASAKF